MGDLRSGIRRHANRLMGLHLAVLALVVTMWTLQSVWWAGRQYFSLVAVWGLWVSSMHIAQRFRTAKHHSALVHVAGMAFNVVLLVTLGVQIFEWIDCGGTDERDCSTGRFVLQTVFCAMLCLLGLLGLRPSYMAWRHFGLSHRNEAHAVASERDEDALDDRINGTRDGGQGGASAKMRPNGGVMDALERAVMSKLMSHQRVQRLAAGCGLLTVVFLGLVLLRWVVDWTGSDSFVLVLLAVGGVTALYVVACTAERHTMLHQCATVMALFFVALTVGAVVWQIVAASSCSLLEYDSCSSSGFWLQGVMLAALAASAVACLWYSVKAHLVHLGVESLREKGVDHQEQQEEESEEEEEGEENSDSGEEGDALSSAPTWRGEQGAVGLATAPLLGGGDDDPSFSTEPLVPAGPAASGHGTGQRVARNLQVVVLAHLCVLGLLLFMLLLMLTGTVAGSRNYQAIILSLSLVVVLPSAVLAWHLHPAAAMQHGVSYVVWMGAVLAAILFQGLQSRRSACDPALHNCSSGLFAFQIFMWCLVFLLAGAGAKKMLSFGRLPAQQLADK